VTGPTEAAPAGPDRTARRAAAIELVFTMILALAAVGTAWAGFQSAKWSGVQANSYAEASAARIESSRLSTEASQVRTVDVITFTEWLNALNAEILADPSVRPDQGYEPTPGTVSGFLYERFRDEFRPAVEAWVALRPLVNPDAPKTPFQMAEYQLASEAEAGQLLDRAERRAADARAANQRSDNYVLLSVMFALVLFFVALGGKARAWRSRGLLLGLSLVTLVAAIGILVTFPIEL
jgi:hypothetical protein